MKIRLWIFGFLVASLAVIYLIKPDYVTKTHLEDQSGAVLAQQYCSSCHLFPQPGLLTKSKWNLLLPQMGLRLGIKKHYGVSYENSVKSRELVVPAKPILSNEEWQKILDFYRMKAPVTMPSQERTDTIEKRLPFFTVEQPSELFSKKQLLATFVKIDTTKTPARIFVASGWENKLFIFNCKLQLLDSITTPGPLVDLTCSNGKWFACIIGKVLGANDEQEGSIRQLIFTSSGKMQWDEQTIFNHLARPVQVIAADLNGDQRTDYVICEFGNIKGMLSWMENKGNGVFQKHVLSPLPGAIKIYIDLSGKNKQPDIWALFAQGKERISRFINKGNGIFEEKIILQFPPIYGSSFFELKDLNRDGYPDIVYTCGDNGDATAVLKPYHGLYLFINDGRGNFKNFFFYPINGCYKALAGDFDGHGNLDIATVSVYTDSRQREEGFIYFKNTGDLHFKPYAMPEKTKFERGVTLDVGKIDGKGKPDILIGNAFFDFGPFGYQKKEPLFYLLRNKK